MDLLNQWFSIYPPRPNTAGDLAGSVGGLFESPPPTSPPPTSPPPPARPPPTPTRPDKCNSYTGCVLPDTLNPMSDSIVCALSGCDSSTCCITPSPPPTRLTRQDATRQVNELCDDFSFNFKPSPTIDYTHYGQSNHGSNPRFDCCESVEDLYKHNKEVIISLSDPVMTNLQNYTQGCIDNGHIPDFIRPICMGYIQNIQNDCNALPQISDLRNGGGNEWENCCTSVNEFHSNVDVCLSEEPGIFQDSYVQSIHEASIQCNT